MSFNLPGPRVSASLSNPQATAETIGVLGEWATRALSFNGQTVALPTLLATPEIATMIQSYQASKPKVYQNDLDLNHFSHLMKDFRLAKAMDKVIFKSIKKAYKREDRIYERKRREKIIRKFLARRANLREFLRIAELSYIDYIAKLNKIAERIILFINTYQDEAIKKMQELLNQLRYLDAQIAYVEKLREQNLEHYSSKITDDLCKSEDFELKDPAAKERVKEKIKTYIKTESEIQFKEDLKKEHLTNISEKEQLLVELEKLKEKYLQEAVIKSLDNDEQQKAPSDDIAQLFNEIETGKQARLQDEKEIEDVEDSIDDLQEMLKEQSEEEESLDALFKRKLEKYKSKDEGFSMPSVSIGVVEGISREQMKLISQNARLQELKDQNKTLQSKIAERKQVLEDLKTRSRLKGAQLESKKNELRALQEDRKQGRITPVLYTARKIEVKQRIRRNDAKLNDLDQQMQAIKAEIKGFKLEAQRLEAEQNELKQSVEKQKKDISSEFKASASLAASAGSPDAAEKDAQNKLLNQLTAQAKPAVAFDVQCAHELRHLHAQRAIVAAQAGKTLFQNDEEMQAIAGICQEHFAKLKTAFPDDNKVKLVLDKVEDSKDNPKLKETSTALLDAAQRLYNANKGLVKEISKIQPSPR